MNANLVSGRGGGLSWRLVAVAVPVLGMAAATICPAMGEELRAGDLDDWRALAAVVKPADGESPWRGIEWLTDVTEARRRAVAEDKPLVIFTAADGSPLGRT